MARRRFLTTAAGAVAVTALPGAPAGAAARYTRYNVTSPQGQAMLAIYARAVERMLALPPEHPHNWLRNAFVHFMDCPHGNWWFYVWHRGYTGYFEQTIRAVSGNPGFTLPYWDWTRLPRIPAGMFDGVLDPTNAAYRRYTFNLEVFTDAIKAPLLRYWNALLPTQRAQLQLRGYATFDDMWNDMRAFNAKTNIASAGDIAFAPTFAARYLTRTNPNLDGKALADVAPDVVRDGLKPIRFTDPVVANSFTSVRATSHNVPPAGRGAFSMLEGLPHNNVHNYIGGAGPLDYGPYGNMTNNLSPIDPIFFLHHSNMDRLWDSWTRKQIRIGQPILPTDPAVRAQLENEPFLFFVDGNARYVTNGRAGMYLHTTAFDYDYQPGFPDDAPQPVGAAALGAAAAVAPTLYQGTLTGSNAGTVTLPGPKLGALAAEGEASSLTLEVTVVRPGSGRSFDVLIDAPEGTTHVGADSPYYAATIAFFGPPMHGMEMPHETTFVVPVPTRSHGLGAAAGEGRTLHVSVVPSYGVSAAPQLTALSAQAR
jgi:tyrosinase